MNPSIQPSLSSSPSQEITYDLFVAYTTESYTTSSFGRSFESFKDATGTVEDEWKAVCFYDNKCIAIRYDV